MGGRVIQGLFPGGRAAVQRRGSADGFAIDPGVLRATGQGMPLPEALRCQMEQALGADFSDVRVHVGPQAQSIGAIAFAAGSDLYFAPGRFQPDSAEGRRLLGHELAHVVQQRQGRVRGRAGLVTVVQDAILEAEAERAGARAALPGRPTAAPGAVVAQRQVGDYAPPPPPTVWDFIKPHLVRANEARRRRRPPAPEVTGEELAALFTVPPAPEPAAAAAAAALAGRRKKGRAAFTRLALTPLSLVEQLDAGGVMTSGPIRIGTRGLEHEYAFQCGSTVIYVHVHRDRFGRATAAHAKSARFKFIAGTRTNMPENIIAVSDLPSYGINVIDMR